MNFLSHYYFNRFSNDPLLVVGCILPDLVRNADPSIKIHPENEHPNKYEKTQSLWAGWHQHITVDAIFHDSEFFRVYSNGIRKSVEPILEESPVKSFFVAHIALELLLDHLLIKHQAIDINAFYTELRIADMQNIDLFFELTEKVSPRQINRFHKFYHDFLSSAYLHSYKDISGICHAVIQICKRIWPLNPVSESREEKLCTVFEEHISILDRVHLHIFADVETGLR